MGIKRSCTTVLLLMLGLAAGAEEITEIIDHYASSRGLEEPAAIAVDAEGTVYVAGSRSDNLFRVTPEGGVSGLFVGLDEPQGLAAGAAGAVFVSSFRSHKVFRATPDFEVTTILGASGDGVNELRGPRGIAVSAAGYVYVAGRESRWTRRATSM